MTRYDTSAQAKLRQSSRRLNLGIAVALLAVASYLTASYTIAYYSPYPPYNAFELVLAMLVYCFAAIPITQAYIRRPHPQLVDVREEGLILRFRKGEPVRIPWEDRPVSVAYDDRTVEGPSKGRRRPSGMEVAVYVPRPGREPGGEAFRPWELELSGEAFEEIKGRMREAGFRVHSRSWGRRRPGLMVEFLRKGEESSQLPEPLTTPRRGPGRSLPPKSRRPARRGPSEGR